MRTEKDTHQDKNTQPRKSIPEVPQKNKRQNDRVQPAPKPALDKIDQASWESFPASDAPGWRP